MIYFTGQSFALALYDVVEASKLFSSHGGTRERTNSFNVSPQREKNKSNYLCVMLITSKENYLLDHNVASQRQLIRSRSPLSLAEL